MKKRFHRWYHRTYAFNRSLRDRLTPPGAFFVVMFFIAFFFGLNTQKSMVFEILSLLTALLLVSRLIEWPFKPRITAERLFPRYGTVGTPVRYRIALKNEGKRREAGLVLLEEPCDPRPTYDEWANTPEQGEEKRNWFDRRMLYYRWEWLIAKRLGATFESAAVPPLAPGETRDIDMYLTPTKRGIIRLEGCRVERADLFGIWKRGVLLPCPGALISLPRIYRVNRPEFCGHRRYHQGGIADARKAGDSEEFMQVREYRPGDPLKKIHWRSTARTGMLAVKEFQDEYYARIGLILDTFRKESFSEELEEAVSIAASYLVGGGGGDEIIELMFVGAEAFSFSVGRGTGSPDRMLEILAGVEPCRDRNFAELTRLVGERLELLCGTVVILTDIDESRKELLARLDAAPVDHLTLLITADPEKMRRRLTELAVGNVHIVEVGKVQEALTTL
ncbi:MAG TPA: DUF58 domain-containing protein [bacterium]|nr:DUF58 domain-containing protein [bacterium]